MKVQKHQEPILEPSRPLSPIIFYILILLDEGASHGYRLLNELEERWGKTASVGAATFYRTIQYLIKDKIIEESKIRPNPKVDDSRRIYYILTEHGREIGRAEKQRIICLAEELQRKNSFEGNPGAGGADYSLDDSATLSNDKDDGALHSQNGVNGHVNNSARSRSSLMINGQNQRARAISASIAECHDGS